MPGVATASELTEALSLGVSVVKLFPAEAIGGVALIRALAAPFPEARFVPTGGLSAENAGGYLALPQVVAVGGSWMVAPPLLAAGKWDEVERLTAEALALGGAA
jgi:2-dehydro-3-deoxyphosphogluconate aldolase/(4S)-4-hydroxy-2-oxoglutarate aldolase